jgi:hypothetical protein
MSPAKAQPFAGVVRDVCAIERPIWAPAAKRQSPQAETVPPSWQTQSIGFLLPFALQIFLAFFHCVLDIQKLPPPTLSSGIETCFFEHLMVFAEAPSNIAVVKKSTEHAATTNTGNDVGL